MDSSCKEASGETLVGELPDLDCVLATGVPATDRSTESATESAFDLATRDGLTCALLVGGGSIASSSRSE